MYLTILALWLLTDFLPFVLRTLDTNTRSFAVTKVTIYIGGQLQYVVVTVGMSKFFEAILAIFSRSLLTWWPLVQ